MEDPVEPGEGKDPTTPFEEGEGRAEKREEKIHDSDWIRWETKKTHQRRREKTEYEWVRGVKREERVPWGIR